MVGSALKKMAQANGMTVAKGVAYGNLRGFSATLSEGAGYKQIVLNTRFDTVSKRDSLRQQLEQRDITKEFRVQELRFAPNGINIVFLDNPGTMKKIEAFLDWFLPLLEQYSASRWDICTECGMPIQQGKWVLRDGVVAFHVHEACAEKMLRQVQESNEQQKQEQTGSYLRGALGAAIGTVIGAVLWALVLMLGYVASIVGLAIGWLANKGYDMLKGKQGKGKVAILIVAVILGVLLGTFLGDGFQLAQAIMDGQMLGYRLRDIPGMLMVLLLVDRDYLMATGGNVLMGLLFAGLGVFAMLRKVSQETADEKIQILE